ncbi:hypothetical protein N7540_010762 [Penicillium herquei]|nr:hypothetical protein N7540_010762 [Penicillium herquei]
MSIAARAREAANKFEEWKDSVSESDLQVEYIENQMFRFNLWTFNNYVFESPRASMDWRLRNAPLLLSTMEDLLEDLKTSLLGVRPEPESVEAILDQLFRFSRAVRRSGILHRLVKIANHIEYDADGVNLTATFQAGISRLVEYYLKGCSASGELSERLVETICLRQRNFSYLKAQRESRSSKKPTERPAQAASRARSTLTSSFSITMPVSTTTRKMKPIKLDPIIELRRPVMTATTAQVDHVPIDHSIQSSIGTDQQQRDTEEDALELPRPPEIPFGLKEWECPYCLIVCPVKEFKPENWTYVRQTSKSCADNVLTRISNRKHILADIMPYICLLDSCPSSNTLFRSKKDWLNHMKNEHATQSWTCLDSAHDTKLSFQTQDEFEQHMHDEHEGQFEEADLEDLIEACFESKPSTVTFTDCPFCPEDSRMNTISGDWAQHMAHHLLAFSRMSFDGYMEEKDQTSDFSGSIDSSGALGAQVLSRTIADELHGMPFDTDERDYHLENDEHYYELALGPSETRSRTSRRAEVERAFEKLDWNQHDASRDLHLTIVPEATEVPPDTEEEKWEFYISRPNFKQYDASSDPILIRFRMNLSPPEKERADEIKEILDLPSSPGLYINQHSESKPSRIEDLEDWSNQSSLPAMSSLDQPVPAPEQPDEDHKVTAISVNNWIIKFLQDWDRIFYADIPFLTSEGSPLRWRDEIERFRLWTTDIGAHRTGNLSLDSRLEDSPDIKEQILWHLSNLEKPMRAIVSQAAHEGFSETFPGYENFPSQGLVLSTYELLQTTIDALFQLSLFLEQRLDIASFEPFDKQHVKEKYPHVSEEIANRLGLTNSLRRFELRHRKRENLLLDRGLDQIFNSREDDASSHSSQTVKALPEEAAVPGRDDLEGHLPPPPIRFRVAPSGSSRTKIFECPYCSSMIAMKRMRDWTRHILNDLQPYVCIYPKCPVPQQMFKSRRAWFLHMESQHFIKESSNLPLNCTFCLSSMLSVDVEEHVGRHLEELALFALPVSEEDNEYDTDSTSSDSGMTHVAFSTAYENPDENHDQIEPSISPDEHSQELNHSESTQKIPVFDDSSSHTGAQILELQNLRLEKCPVANCEYHITGFVHKHDRDRHFLTHYKGGSWECNFCLRSGTSDAIRFRRVATFKNHLVSVHSVSPDLSTGRYKPQASDGPGECNICKRTYRNPQSFHDHLEECVRRKVLLDILKEDLDLPLLPDDGSEGQPEDLDPPLFPDDGSDGQPEDLDLPLLPDYGSEGQAEAYDNANMSLGSLKEPEDYQTGRYLSLDPDLQHPEDGIVEHVSDKSRNWRGSLETLPSQTDGYTNASFKPDAPTTIDLDTTIPDTTTLKHLSDKEPDVILIRHKLFKSTQYIGKLYPLVYDPGAIENDMITIGMVRKAAALKLRATSEHAICMFHNDKPLRYDFMSCREAGIEHNSEVHCLISKEINRTESQKFDSDTITDRNQLQAWKEIEQDDVDKAEDDSALDDKHESVPSSAQHNIPEIPDLSLIPTPMERATVCKSYFQQELLPIFLELLVSPIEAAEKPLHDTSLMHVRNILLELSGILHEIGHGSDASVESILVCQKLKPQVDRTLENLNIAFPSPTT